MFLKITKEDRYLIEDTYLIQLDRKTKKSRYSDIMTRLSFLASHYMVIVVFTLIGKQLTSNVFRYDNVRCQNYDFYN